MSRPLDPDELDRRAQWHMKVAEDYRVAAANAKSRSDRVLMQQLQAAAVTRANKLAKRALMMRREAEVVAVLRASAPAGTYIHITPRGRKTLQDL